MIRQAMIDAVDRGLEALNRAREANEAGDEIDAETAIDEAASALQDLRTYFADLAP